MPEYRTPGVYIEEISAGPRPVAMSSTTETGFVSVLTLPSSFLPGRGKAAGLFLPGTEDVPLLTWNRGVAFRGLFAPTMDAPRSAGAAAPSADSPDAAKPEGKKARPQMPSGVGNRLSEITAELLPGRWSVDPPGVGDVVSISNTEGLSLRFPARRTLVSEVTTERGVKEWDLAVGADENQIVHLIADRALELGIKHNGELSAADPSSAPVQLDVAAIHDALQGPAQVAHSMDGFEAWLHDLAARLYVQLRVQGRNELLARAESEWGKLSPEAKSAWMRWVRAHPGIRRLEIGVRGFLQNGGRSAYFSLGVQAVGAAGPDKRKMLEQSFDGITSMAMICAPGLDLEWQKEILAYAGPRGRGDLFAILETPRYLLTRGPDDRSLAKDTRWTAHGPYEMFELQTVATPDQSELRFGGYADDRLLDRCIPRDDTGHGAAYGPWLVVENPLSTGAHDRYVIAPPSGYVAGVIAATDLKPGGGVHKAPANEGVVGVSELVTEISDREQAKLNEKGINIIRHRAGGGIRVWGARTVSSDPLWTYVNVRRLFLFVERSVRDAIQWAVFLPNTPTTRGDLKGTINSFLYRLYMQGMLDGATWKDAFSVRCDADNNPDPDVRAGLLTVDVELRPVFPAEFIRVRFRQSPMRSEVMES